MEGLRTGRAGHRSVHDPIIPSSVELYESLLILASDTADRQARQHAARTLLGQLRRWASHHALNRTLRGLRPASREVLLDDAIQHVAVVASTGKTRFRGTTPAEAVVWCRTVLHNHLRSEQRRQLRMASAVDAVDTLDVPPGSSRDGRLNLHDFDRSILEHLHRTRRPKDVASLYRSVCCYFEHLAGVPVEVQLRRWAGDLAEPREVNRARNRIYQYHHRGRRLLAELLSDSAAST